ncbi:MAG: MBL fold metallo-hydrolase [Polyangiales bacterium]
MNGPISHGAFSIAPNITSLSSATPVPGFGILPVNAFLVEGSEPVLIDTGLPSLIEETIASLATRIDPADLRWIWLTHCDADHIGALEPLLAMAPRARVVTNYLGMGKLSMRTPLPPERFYLINPGQSLDVGDRKLHAVSMPSYDAPETMGAFDPGARALFSSDCFGALLAEELGVAPIHEIAAVDTDSLIQGLSAWAMVDAPWLTHVQDRSFRASLAELERLAPEHVLSAHLPPARGKLSWLSAQLDAARGSDPFIGPDQSALEAMLSAAA